MKVIALWLLSVSLLCAKIISPVPHIYIAWDEMDLESENVISFRFHYGRESGNYTNIIEINLLDTSLSDNGVGRYPTNPISIIGVGNWFGALTLYNSVGDGPYSNEIAFEIKPAPVAPFRLSIGSFFPEEMRQYLIRYNTDIKLED